MDIESLIFKNQKKQRIDHADLHSGNIMLEERKLSTDEMKAKIAAMAKKESGNRCDKLS
jgi:predicted unusual protein kinase regulating ubiquinone biosynthesis (AarF/ABC1/UbiB family)